MTPTTPPLPDGRREHDPSDTDAEGRPRRRIAVTVSLLAVAVLVGGWIYVLFVYDPGLMIDELADRTFPEAAEPVCAAADRELAELPTADMAATADDRADEVERSNVILRRMVGQLRPLAPTEPQQVAEGVNEWLDDWETYIGNRERYVENLRLDDEARFLESTKGSDTKGITRAINSFAQVNRMESCTTPADLS